MEIKLTDEQVRKASMEFSRVTSTGPFPNLFPGLRAAAPHLQAKWKPPTNEEIMYVRNLVGSITGVETAQVISDFVNLRNENLLPKPVDPAVLIVSKMLRDEEIMRGDTFDVAAAKIVAAVMASREEK